MAGGRRNVKSSSFNKHQAHASDERHAELPTQPRVTPPKHIPIPDLPPSSDFYFELFSLLLSLFAMTGQYINLYRSVFWLPYSHTEYALNYYLIDYYAVTYTLLIVGRRFPVYLLKKMCFLCLPSTYHSSCITFVHIFISIILGPALIFCGYYIVKEQGLIHLATLLYPIVIHIVAMGKKLTTFLELIVLPQERQTGTKSKHSSNVKQSSAISHVCSMSAETIREEVETLRSDFNYRWKQVLLNTFFIFYHTTFLPCLFSQKELEYDFVWACQQMFFTGISCFTLYVIHCFPPRYCDVLHRAALHLGRWQKVEVKNVHVPYSIWTETSTWNQGALVKHSKELFKAEGISNAAEPGHSGHNKFYMLFKNPTIPVGFLFAIEVLLTCAILLVMCQSYVWNELLPLQLLFLINCKTLYTITKTYFVIKKIYHEEKVLISKFCS